ncbi:hypothetical protein C0992_012450, partial [Termitomyces sp. T32_za158]
MVLLIIAVATTSESLTAFGVRMLSVKPSMVQRKCGVGEVYTRKKADALRVDMIEWASKMFRTRSGMSKIKK